MEGVGDKIIKASETAYFTFGRFQPPTLGHAGLIQRVKRNADLVAADAYIFVSSKINKMEKYLASKKYKNMLKTGVFESVMDNENPLSVYQKVKYLKKMHGSSGINIINTIEFGQSSIIDIVDMLGPLGMGYKQLVMLVGSDRVSVFRNAFRDKPFVNIEPFGAKRAVGGISGTKMRLAAVSGKFDEFKAGVITGQMNEKDAFDLMNDIRVGLGFDAIIQKTTNVTASTASTASTDVLEQKLANLTIVGNRRIIRRSKA